jgi:hypothetical protein
VLCQIGTGKNTGLLTINLLCKNKHNAGEINAKGKEHDRGKNMTSEEK